MRLHHTYHTIPADGSADLRHFYGDLLGLPEIPIASVLQGQDRIWFQVGDDHLHFGFTDTWERGHAEHHIALLFDDLPPVLERLRAAGYTIHQVPSFEDYGYRRYYTHDPFGRQVELVTLLNAATV